jgi:hypothetical protein
MHKVIHARSRDGNRQQRATYVNVLAKQQTTQGKRKRLGMRKHNTVTAQPSKAQTFKDKNKAALKCPIRVREGLMQRLQWRRQPRHSNPVIPEMLEGDKNKGQRVNSSSISD